MRRFGISFRFQCDLAFAHTRNDRTKKLECVVCILHAQITCVSFACTWDAMCCIEFHYNGKNEGKENVNYPAQDCVAHEACRKSVHHTYLLTAYSISLNHVSWHFMSTQVFVIWLHAIANTIRLNMCRAFNELFGLEVDFGLCSLQLHHRLNWEVCGSNKFNCYDLHSPVWLWNSTQSVEFQTQISTKLSQFFFCFRRE